MKRRLVILTEIIAPYRIPVLNALVQDPEIDPYVIFLSETDRSLRDWKVYLDDIRFEYAVLPSWRRRIGKYNLLLNRGLTAALERIRPDAIVCGGYNYLSSWSALQWARQARIPLLLWCESTLRDRRNSYPLVELLKRKFVCHCDAFVVPGKSARDYLLDMGVKGDITTAPNAVDIDFFARASRAGRNGFSPHHSFELPDRYFLYVGRLVTEKGIFELLEAYAKLPSAVKSAVGLVYAGDGPQKEALLRKIARLSSAKVLCVGFLDRENLAPMYGGAEALVHPTHSDTWGLVINEAMACGLPVITTSAAGCARDLVEDSVNGLLVHPSDIAGLSSAMLNLASDPGKREELGSYSLKRIQAYSPQACASGIATAAKLLWTN